MLHREESFLSLPPWMFSPGSLHAVYKDTEGAIGIQVRHQW